MQRNCFGRSARGSLILPHGVPVPFQELALDAVNCVTVDVGGGKLDIDIKKYAKVEKIPGGDIQDCRVLKGVMFNKDVVAPGRMKRRVCAMVSLVYASPSLCEGGRATHTEILSCPLFLSFVQNTSISLWYSTTSMGCGCVPE